MPYDAALLRSGASITIPNENVGEIMQGAIEQSAVLRTFSALRIPRGQSTIPVLSALPYGYWQHPKDTGLRQVSSEAFVGRQITAEEVSVVIPVANYVLDDSEYDLMSALMPAMQSELARKVDDAILLGVDQPAGFGTALIPAAIAAGNTRELGTATQGNGGVGEDISQLFALIEQDGFEPNAVVAPIAFRSLLRGARDTTGQRLLDVDGGGQRVYGVDIINSAAGCSWGTHQAVAFDRRQAIVGVSHDMAMRLDSSGVITDSTGKVIYNLSQQNMSAIYLTMRLGFAVANPARPHSRQGTNEKQTATQAGLTSGATFTLSFGGHTTPQLDRESEAADVQSALEALPSIGRENVSVTRSGSTGARVYTIEFRNALGSKDVSAMTATASAGTVTIAEQTKGVAASGGFPAAVLINAS